LAGRLTNGQRYDSRQTAQKSVVGADNLVKHEAELLKDIES